MTHVFIVKGAVVGSPHAILHGSLTNQIAIQSFLSLFD